MSENIILGEPLVFSYDNNILVFIYYTKGCAKKNWGFQLLLCFAAESIA